LLLVYSLSVEVLGPGTVECNSQLTCCHVGLGSRQLCVEISLCCRWWCGSSTFLAIGSWLLAVGSWLRTVADVCQKHGEQTPGKQTT